MIRSTFRLSTLPIITQPQRLVAENARVANVPEAFNAISQIGDPLAVRDGEVFPAFAYTGAEVRGARDPANSFHGVQRLRKGPYVIVSGGYGTGRRRSHVFVAKFGTRRGRGPWGSNLLKQATPAGHDRILACYGLDTFRWRAGGLSRLGDIVAVPIEGSRKSRVVFLHAKQPEALERFKVEIDRPGVPSADAAALERLPDGRYLVGVWREIRGNHPGRLDLYVSHDDVFANGFRRRRLSWTFNGFSVDSERLPRYQNINFITEQRAGDQTQLYMIGTENGAASAPNQNGPNFADLWRVRLPRTVVSDGTAVGGPTLEHVATREFHCAQGQGNFDAGAGIHVDDAGALHLYSCFHWRVERTVRLVEYASHKPGVISDVSEAWIELYEHDEFRGKRLMIYGNQQADIPNYGQIFVDGGDFDDRVSSVRYQIPKGMAYRLYRDANFKETRTFGKPFIDLKGTGAPVSISDLKDRPHKFGDRVSSSKFVP